MLIIFGISNEGTDSNPQIDISISLEGRANPVTNEPNTLALTSKSIKSLTKSNLKFTLK